VDQSLDQQHLQLQMFQGLDHPRYLAQVDQCSVQPLLPLLVHQRLAQPPPLTVHQYLVARLPLVPNLPQCLEGQAVEASLEDSVEQRRQKIQTRILLEAPHQHLVRHHHRQETCLQAPAVPHSVSPALTHHLVAPPPARSHQLSDQVEVMLLRKDLEFKVIPPRNRQLEASVEQQPLDLHQLLDHPEDSEQHQLLEERQLWGEDQRLVVDPLLALLPVTLPLLDPPHLPEDHHLEERPPVVRHSAQWQRVRPQPSEE